MRLDDLDHKILAQLATDGRATFADIGAAIGLSAPAVKRRVDKLVADGVIQGFTVRVEPDAVGVGTEAFVELHCRSRTGPAEITAMVSGHPEVVAAYTITGESDALLHLRAGSMAEVEAVIERIRAHPNAERTNSRVVLSRLLGSGSGGTQSLPPEETDQTSLSSGL